MLCLLSPGVLLLFCLLFIVHLLLFDKNPRVKHSCFVTLQCVSRKHNSCFVKRNQFTRNKRKKFRSFPSWTTQWYGKVSYLLVTCKQQEILRQSWDQYPSFSSQHKLPQRHFQCSLKWRALLWPTTKWLELIIERQNIVNHWLLHDSRSVFKHYSGVFFVCLGFFSVFLPSTYMPVSSGFACRQGKLSSLHKAKNRRNLIVLILGIMFCTLPDQFTRVVSEINAISKQLHFLSTTRNAQINVWAWVWRKHQLKNTTLVISDFYKYKSLQDICLRFFRSQIKPLPNRGENDGILIRGCQSFSVQYMICNKKQLLDFCTWWQTWQQVCITYTTMPELKIPFFWDCNFQQNVLWAQSSAPKINVWTRICPVLSTVINVLQISFIFQGPKCMKL